MQNGARRLFVMGLIAAGGCDTHFEPQEPREVDHAESRWYQDASGEQPDTSDEARGMKMEWELELR